VLLAILAVLAQATPTPAPAVTGEDGMNPAVLIGLLSAAVTAGAALMGAVTAWRKRGDDARKMESEEDSIIITQAQGANLILDASIKVLNTQLDRERLRAEHAESRLETLTERVEAREEQLDTDRARAMTAEKALGVCRRQLADLRGGES
jgi:uncharacterized transporter YbjL